MTDGLNRESDFFDRQFLIYLEEGREYTPEELDAVINALEAYQKYQEEKR